MVKLPFLAARCGKIEVFHHLTEIAADINIHDVNSNTALHHAAILGSVEIIKILLKECLLKWQMQLTERHYIFQYIMVISKWRKLLLKEALL